MSRSLDVNPATSWTTLNAFTDRTQPTNPCNCAQFFAVPPLLDSAILAARGCELGPHPKTMMLNSDMVQVFPMSGAGPVVNLIEVNPGAIQDLGVGDIDEICSPAVVTPNPSLDLIFPQASIAGRIRNKNCAGANEFNAGCPLNPIQVNTLQGYGCVKNSHGNPANFLGVANIQTIASTLLTVDPNTPSVSLWATVQSFLTLGLGGSCIEGIFYNLYYVNSVTSNRRNLCIYVCYAFRYFYLPKPFRWCQKPLHRRSSNCSSKLFNIFWYGDSKTRSRWICW